MTAGRLFLLLSFLTAAGIGVARPDVAWKFVGQFAGPLLAQTVPAGTTATAAVTPAKSEVVSGETGTDSPSVSPASDAPTSQSEETTDTEALPNFVTTDGLTFGAELNAPEATSDAMVAPVPPTNPLADAPASHSGSNQSAEKRDPPAKAPTGVTAAVETKSKSIKLSVEPVQARVSLSVPKPPVVPAKALFGSATTGAPLKARAIGSYARGCLSGGVALPVDGPAWQAMRLSRNRNWGHPKLIKLVERLAVDAQKHDDWSGLLVGDISQPRGGPMLTGHASHQVGLDADVWFTPMPARRLSRQEREEVSATSMLDKTNLAVNPQVFTPNHVKLIKRAASYPEVERVLVHPAIKKALCEAAGADRGWLGKVRPIGGHYYHFHIRMGCPPGETICKPQTPTTGDDGCAKEVDEWLARLAPRKGPPVPRPPGYKPPPPKPPITMAELPPECRVVLESGPDGVKNEQAILRADTSRPMEAGTPLETSSQTAEARAFSFSAGAALRPHLLRERAAEQSE